MHKILLIIKREYITRVRNRTFVITTILLPLLFVGFIFGSAYLTAKDSKETLSVAVRDNSGIFKNNLQSTEDITFDFPQGIDSNNYSSKGYDALLTIADKNDTSQHERYLIHSKKAIGSSSKNAIKSKINAVVENQLLLDAGIQKTKLDSIHAQAQTGELSRAKESNGANSKEDAEGVAQGIGYFCGILIYITMLIYGMMVMRGVMEEKTSRIAEVIVSSVKPFQLMFGKIVGIGAVGLTQFLMWIILIFAIITGVSMFASPDTLHQVQAAQQSGAMPGGAAAMQSQNAQHMFDGIRDATASVNWALIIVCFLFYFLAGYLFYAALFAAIGSVIDDVQSAQSLTMPITMPIIFSFIIATSAARNPDSTLAVWASIVPFSSPMVMMARLAYGVPGTVSYLELISSMLVLVLGFLFTTWLAGKIYRTGILMYGKKPSWATMFKWAFRKA